MPDLKLPKIGFGTWQLSPKKGVCKTSVLKAIEIGFRHIDTAQMYGNEHAVGDAIAEATIDRKELIIATKLGLTKLRPSRVIKSTGKSLEKLKLDYVDMLYVHWPMPLFYNHIKTLGAMSQLVDEGKIKHICVSNFNVKLLEKATSTCDKPIAALQVEHHPLLKQITLRKHVEKSGTQLVAYSPLARGKIKDNPEILQIAEKYKVSPYQISLAWIMEHGAVPIPKATSEDHIRDCYDSLKVTLDKEDLDQIGSIQTVKRIGNPPLVKPKWDIP